MPTKLKAGALTAALVLSGALTSTAVAAGHLSILERSAKGNVDEDGGA